jgi:predicted nucleic acid-binding protein
VILADTSAWVEFLRGTGSEAHRRLRELLEQDGLATTDVVLMEVLAGARDIGHIQRLRALLARCAFIATQGPRDYEDAASIYRACRASGDSPRGLPDCLIASVAIRRSVAVLHADSDFDTIARHTPLALA